MADQQLGNYSRRLKYLSKADVYILGKSLNMKLNKDDTREVQMKNILREHPELENQQEKLYYYSIQLALDGDTIHGMVEEDQIDMTTVIADFPERVAFGKKCDFVKIFAELQLERDEIQKQLEQDRLVSEKLTLEQIAREQLESEQVKREQTVREQIVHEQSEKEKANREQIERDQLFSENLVRNQVQLDKIDQEKYEREKLENDKLIDEKLVKDQAKKAKSAYDQLIFDQLATQNFPVINTVQQTPSNNFGRDVLTNNELLLQTLMKSQINLSQIMAKNSQPRPSTKLCNIKLQFCEDRGIEQFLSSVESYCDANNITIDDAKIKVALAALDVSEHGLTLKQSLTGDEKQQWSLFKTKLTAVLGKDHEFYREKFTSFKRGILSPGLALAKLTLFYKKSFPVTRELLNDDDKQRLFLAFVESLDQPIQGMIKNEEYRLDLDTVANRVQQLERNFLVKKNPFFTGSTATVNAVIDTPQLADPLVNRILKLEVERSEQSMLLEKERTRQQQSLLNSVNSLVLSLSKSGLQVMPSRKTPQFKSKFRESKTENTFFKGLEGHCLHHVRGGCNRQHCRFIHAEIHDIPDSVRETANQVNNQK